MLTKRSDEIQSVVILSLDRADSNYNAVGRAGSKLGGTLSHSLQFISGSETKTKGLEQIVARHGYASLNICLFFVCQVRRRPSCIHC